MTVQELIKKLNDMPKDAEVMLAPRSDCFDLIQWAHGDVAGVSMEPIYEHHKALAKQTKEKRVYVANPEDYKNCKLVCIWPR